MQWHQDSFECRGNDASFRRARSGRTLGRVWGGSRHDRVTQRSGMNAVTAADDSVSGYQACVQRINSKPDLGLALGRLVGAFDAKAQLVCPARPRAHKCRRMRARINKNAQARTHARTNALAHARTRARDQARMYACIHKTTHNARTRATHIRTRTRTRLRSRTHVRARACLHQCTQESNTHTRAQLEKLARADELP